MNVEHPRFERYQEVQAYVDWTEDDARLLREAAATVEPHLAGIVDDFYATIERYPFTRSVITGGQEQIDRLKGSLAAWIRELFSGRYDQEYVERRWRVGWRHVEIGLDQVYTNAAMARIRNGLLRVLYDTWPGDRDSLSATARALNKLLDLDLTIIEDAYQAEARNRQQRYERLAAVGQVSGGVAHELRNPLNVVKTSVYYLLHARSASAEKKTEHLQRIERHVELADGVITALSNFARLPAPTTKTFAVADCVREAIETNPLPQIVEVTVEGLEGLPHVTADPRQLLIVFGNLIRNARDAMPDGGRLRISGRACGGMVEVEVADTGVGIPREQILRVMEPLYTTKARGLGLGLALARSILDKNQGELRVTSEVGRGTQFVVRLAVAEPAEGASPT